MLIGLLVGAFSNESVIRQASKALANLGVCKENKRLIASHGGIPPLIKVVLSSELNVAVEAVAALANLAVDGMLSDTFI